MQTVDHLDIENGRLYAFYTGGNAMAKVDLGNVIGPTGPKGDTGATGPQGPKGDAGASDAGEVTYDPTETYQSGTAGAALNDLNRQINHFDDNLPGTVQTVNFGADGKPSSVVHTKNGTTVRTDAYTWGDGTVTETRTTADGSYITMVTDLSTLVTTISEIQEAS